MSLRRRAPLVVRGRRGLSYFRFEVVLRFIPQPLTKNSPFTIYVTLGTRRKTGRMTGIVSAIETGT